MFKICYLEQRCPNCFEPQHTLIVNHDQNHTQRVVRVIFKKFCSTPMCRCTYVGQQWSRELGQVILDVNDGVDWKLLLVLGGYSPDHEVFNNLMTNILQNYTLLKTKLSTLSKQSQNYLAYSRQPKEKLSNISFRDNFNIEVLKKIPTKVNTKLKNLGVRLCDIRHLSTFFKNIQSDYCG